MDHSLIHDKLMAASQLIAATGLAKGHAALTVDGKPAGPLDPLAYRFCVRGAIAYVCRRSHVGFHSVESYVMRSLRLNPGYTSSERKLVEWNNAEERIAEEVAHVLANAARLAKRDGTTSKGLADEKRRA